MDDSVGKFMHPMSARKREIDYGNSYSESPRLEFDRPSQAQAVTSGATVGEDLGACQEDDLQWQLEA
ncbi:BQ5605_C002g01679 [Microbotryum silenes-dioicae]|uniref:BQ5605_C002g01679 protein n=1 Tax=Microbotryum silenes-dioicae TaxID=796604 RepID=A0A2X0P2D7_9BASI|nr:BQ5605_C002g01679 [Microbotryum silenes-dioicae]